MNTNITLIALSISALSCMIADKSVAVNSTEKPLTILLAEAKNGDVISTLQLRQAAFHGNEEAMKILSEALNNNNIKPLNTLMANPANATATSVQMLQTLVVEYDDDDAEDALIKLAKDGNKHALDLFLATAKTGNSSAINILQEASKSGSKIALDALIELAQQNDSYAIYQLSELTKFGNKEAKECLIELAKKNYSSAIYQLSELTKFGNKEAKGCLIELSKSNNAYAIEKLIYQIKMGDEDSITVLSELIADYNKNAIGEFKKLATEEEQKYVVKITEELIKRGKDHYAFDVLVDAAKGKTKGAIDTIIRFAKDGNESAITSLYKIIRFEEYHKNINSQQALEVLIELTKNGNMHAWGYVADIADIHSDPSIRNAAFPFRSKPKK